MKQEEEENEELINGHHKGEWEDRKGIGLAGCGDHMGRRTGRRCRKE
jgi:hypothetical protein